MMEEKAKSSTDDATNDGPQAVMMSYLSAAVVVISFAVTQANIVALTADDKQRLIDRHNEARAAEPASWMPDLVWDSALEQEAQAWTDKCNFAHQTGQPWGENIAAKSARHTDNGAAIDYMVGLWTSEQKYNVNGTYIECCSRSAHTCCHYSQVIWAKTEKVGCGMTLCPSLTTKNGAMTNSAFLACYYDPPGNHPVTHCEQDWRPFIPA